MRYPIFCAAILFAAALPAAAAPRPSDPSAAQEKRDDEKDYNQLPDEDTAVAWTKLYGDAIMDSEGFPENRIRDDLRSHTKARDDQQLKYPDPNGHKMLDEVYLPADQDAVSAYNQLVERSLMPMARAAEKIDQVLEQIRPMVEQLKDGLDAVDQAIAPFQGPPNPKGGDVGRMAALIAQAQKIKGQLPQLKNMIEQGADPQVDQAASGIEGARGMVGKIQALSWTGQSEEDQAHQQLKNKAGYRTAESVKAETGPLLNSVAEKLGAALEKSKKSREEYFKKLTDKDPQNGLLAALFQAVEKGAEGLQKSAEEALKRGPELDQLGAQLQSRPNDPDLTQQAQAAFDAANRARGETRRAKRPLEDKPQAVEQKWQELQHAGFGQVKNEGELSGKLPFPLRDYDRRSPGPKQDNQSTPKAVLKPKTGRMKFPTILNLPPDQAGAAAYGQGANADTGAP